MARSAPGFRGNEQLYQTMYAITYRSRETCDRKLCGKGENSKIKTETVVYIKLICLGSPFAQTRGLVSSKIERDLE